MPKLPPSFSIDSAVKAFDASEPATLGEGDVHRALPDGAFGRLYSAETREAITSSGHHISGHARRVGTRWRFVRGEFTQDVTAGSGTPLLKVYIDANNAVCLVGLRPGTVVGRLANNDRAALILGFSKAGHSALQCLPNLRVDYSNSDKRNLVRWNDPEKGFTIHYAFRTLWTYDRSDLRYAGFSITDGVTPVRNEASRNSPLELLREMIAGILELEPSASLDHVFAPPPPGARPPLVRGQLVVVRFDQQWIPCLVVSSTRFNEQAANCTIVARGIPWRENHPGAGLPEIPRDYLKLLDMENVSDRRWSIAVGFLRAVATNRSYVLSGRTPSTRLIFGTDELFLEQVTSALRRHYGRRPRAV